MVRDPGQLRAYVVTTGDEGAIATGKYLWSAAQQIGLTVAGAIANSTFADQAGAEDAIAAAFAPLPVMTLPYSSGNFQPLVTALGDLSGPVSVPNSMSVDVATSSVKLFLPGFDKTQVKLTQYGPEVTVEAGDQRHNLSLPPALNGRSVTGAKFQDGYLIITFGS
jgi:arsenite-transporting ATPase